MQDDKAQEATLNTLLLRVDEIKNAIGNLITKLEMENESLSWPSVLDNFAIISSQINILMKQLKTDKLPSLRSYVLLPLHLSPDRDLHLEQLTEGRVQSFNHDIVPNYLRTKPDTEVDEKYQQIHNRATQLTQENIQKQINNLNKITGNLIDMVQNKKDELLVDSTRAPTTSMSSLGDTTMVIGAITFGHYIKPKPIVEKPTPAPGAQSQSTYKPPTSTIRTTVRPANTKYRQPIV